jgi:hypothetical protein
MCPLLHLARLAKVMVVERTKKHYRGLFLMAISWGWIADRDFLTWGRIFPLSYFSAREEIITLSDVTHAGYIMSTTVQRTSSFRRRPEGLPHEVLWAMTDYEHRVVRNIRE